MTLLVLVQVSQAIRFTEHDVLSYLWEFVAWMLGILGAACVSGIGILWHWLGRQFKNSEASRLSMEHRLRQELQTVASTTGLQVEDLTRETRQMREAFIRLHPDVRLD